jgi:ketopantoate hydroxymethyltransferase
MTSTMRKTHRDSQVLVSYGVLGLCDTFAPAFAKQYAQLGQVIVHAAKGCGNDVREGLFPKQHSATHEPAILPIR